MRLAVAWLFFVTFARGTHFWCKKNIDGSCESSSDDVFSPSAMRELVRNVTSMPRPSSKGPVDASTIRNKVLAGYQGWDGARSTWDHWSNDGSPPDPAKKNEHFEMVPEMGEYPAGSLHDTNFKYKGDGSVVKLYENAADGVVDLHFQWMEKYGLDGVLIQRFITECTSPGKALDQRNTILQQMDAAAAKHGRVYAMMWDMSGGSNQWDTDIKNDYNTYVKKYTTQAQYLKEDGKPVVCIFGIGLGDHTQATPSNSLELIHWLQGQGLYVIGSGPYYWRTGGHDSAKGFDDVHAAFDAIMPWAVGRYNNVGDFNNILNQVKGDAALTSSRNQDYAPIAYAGYSYRDGGNFNKIKRNGGQFFKAQSDAFLQLQGATFFYIAMFDEVQEGTAIYKFAANDAESAAGRDFVTASMDGTACPGDLYLQMAGQYASAAKSRPSPPTPPPPAPTPPHAPTPPPAPTPSDPSSLKPGASLGPDKHLVSNQGNAHLEMQGSDGNLVLYSGSKTVWSSNTTGHPGAHLDFQGSDGNLVLYDAASSATAQSTALWSSGPHSGAVEVNLQGDCNLVIKDTSGATLWALGTSC